MNTIEKPKFKTISKEKAEACGFKPFSIDLNLSLQEDRLFLANAILEAKAADPAVKLVLVENKNNFVLWTSGLKKPDYVQHRAPGVHVGLKNPLPSNTRHQKSVTLN